MIERVNIYNYSIGDKIQPENFFYKNYMDSAVLTGTFRNDTNLSVSTWFDTIVGIGYSIDTRDEFDSISFSIGTKLKKEPKIMDSLTSSGLIISGKEFSWHDSLTGDDISLFFYTDSIGNYRKGELIISNDKIIKEMIPNEKTIEISKIDKK
ncbi:MAG: hypothetical protein WC384_20905 [Prolixibacteraceae bacterium]